MQIIISGVVLILFGVIYQVKPNLFKRWIWKRTNIAQRMLSPEAYIKYIKCLGLVYILAGVAHCVFEFSHL